MPQKGGMLKAILPATLLAGLFKGTRKGRSLRSKSGKRMVGGKRRRKSRTRKRSRKSRSRKSRSKSRRRRRRMKGGDHTDDHIDDSVAHDGGRRRRRKSRSKRRKSRKSRSRKRRR